MTGRTEGCPMRTFETTRCDKDEVRFELNPLDPPYSDTARRAVKLPAGGRFGGWQAKENLQFRVAGSPSGRAGQRSGPARMIQRTGQPVGGRPPLSDLPVCQACIWTGLQLQFSVPTRRSSGPAGCTSTTRRSSGPAGPSVPQARTLRRRLPAGGSSSSQ